VEGGAGITDLAGEAKLELDEEDGAEREKEKALERGCGGNAFAHCYWSRWHGNEL
jgi:hypothetical protein